MKTEIWKDIPDYETRYQASTLGRIRSLERKRNACYGSTQTMKGKVLKPTANKDGYLFVALYGVSGMKYCSVARMVAKTFVENEYNKPEINHINGVRTDNSAENLEWCTNAENIHHRCYVMKKMIGSNHFRSRLKEENIYAIRLMLSHKFQFKQIADTFGVFPANIRNIRDGVTWKTVGLFSDSL